VTLSECARKVRAVEERTQAELRNWKSNYPDKPDLGPVDRINTVFEELNVFQAIGEHVKAAVDAYCAAVRRDNQDDVLRACLVVEVLTRAFAPPSQPAYVSQFEFLRLGPDAHSPVYPLDNYAALGDRKLYGIRLAHFGAFVDEAWRASDFTWGRLDAVHHLLRLFIPDPDIRKRTERRLHLAILREEDFDKGRMEENLKELVGDDRELFRRQLARKGGSEQAGDVIEAALRLFTGEGSPLRSSLREVFRIAFTRNMSGSAWFSPLRILSTPGRWLWWRQVPRNPVKVLRSSFLGLAANMVMLIVTAVAIGWPLAECLDWFRLGTVLGILFGLLLVFVLEALFHHWRLRRREPG
jgi:hypothetical protein